MYNRDYSLLTSNEVEIREHYYLMLDKESNGTIIKAEKLLRLDEILRPHPAIYYYDSLFPNNYLLCFDITDKKDIFKKSLVEFKYLISNKDTTERNILNFIKNDEAFFLIGSIVKKYSDWGHHGLYLFPEFQLGTDYKVDYLLVGKNSHGFHFMFIELENVHKNITTKSGGFGETIRKGIHQIELWEIWLEKNYGHLKPIFDKKKNTIKVLPNEFFELDKTRVSFCVVAGRSSSYNEFSNRLRRKYKDDSKIIILHYDNIIDCAEKTLREGNY